MNRDPLSKSAYTRINREMGLRGKKKGKGQRKNVPKIRVSHQDDIKEYNRRIEQVPRPINQQTNSKPQQSSEALAYLAIKQSIKTVYLSLKVNEPINPANVGLSPRELAIAATSPASSTEERLQAIEVILKFPSVATASILRNVVEKAYPGSARRLLAAEALMQMGEKEHLDRVSRGEHPRLNAVPLSWQVLPAGWWNDRRYTNLLNNQHGFRSLVIERLRFVDSLRPRSRYIGSPRFGNYAYWVFVFASHVIAECPLEGNALYVIRGTDDWRNLLSRSKRNLLMIAPHRVDRIVHNGDWKTNLMEILKL